MMKISKGQNIWTVHVLNHVVKIVIPFKLIRRFKTISIEIPARFLKKKMGSRSKNLYGNTKHLIAKKFLKDEQVYNGSTCKSLKDATLSLQVKMPNRLKSQ